MKLIIIIFLVCILAIIFVVKPLTREKKEIDIEDRCGPFMGSIVHTVGSEDICKMRCRAQCETNDFKYKGVKYTDGALGCNSCTCICVR